jgi:hypothetical protein
MFSVCKLPDEIRARIHVDANTGCWHTKLVFVKVGYRPIPIRRYLFEFFHGKTKSQLTWLCLNSTCVNPNHAKANIQLTIADFLPQFVQEDTKTGCLNWLGRMDGSARARFPAFHAGGATHNVRKELYVLKKGKLPAGNRLVCTCRNAACLNMEHIAVHRIGKHWGRKELVVSDEVGLAILAMRHRIPVHRLASVFGLTKIFILAIFSGRTRWGKYLPQNYRIPEEMAVLLDPILAERQIPFGMVYEKYRARALQWVLKSQHTARDQEAYIHWAGLQGKPFSLDQLAEKYGLQPRYLTLQIQDIAKDLAKAHPKYVHLKRTRRCGVS